MHRFKFKSLIKWKLDDKRKPLILLGARQVGKTWLVQEFGNTEYRQVAYINFEHPNTPKALFETDFEIDRIITVLNAYCKLKITPEDTLIVFDEIQAAPKGITSLKYFHENAREYHVIAAGSLLGVNIHPEESFPVGKVVQTSESNSHFSRRLQERGTADKSTPVCNKFNLGAVIFYLFFECLN